MAGLCSLLTSSLGHTGNKRQESYPLKVASNYANLCFWLEASSLVFQRYILSPGSFLSSFWESKIWGHFLKTHLPTHSCFTLKCKQNKTSQQNSTVFFLDSRQLVPQLQIVLLSQVLLQGGFPPPIWSPFHPSVTHFT